MASLPLLLLLGMHWLAEVVVRAQGKLVCRKASPAPGEMPSRW